MYEECLLPYAAADNGLIGLIVCRKQQSMEVMFFFEILIGFGLVFGLYVVRQGEEGRRVGSRAHIGIGSEALYFVPLLHTSSGLVGLL